MTNSAVDSTIGAAYNASLTRLGKISETATLDARKLLAHVIDRPSSWLVAHPEATLTTGQAAQLENLLARMERGDPLPYILGKWEFFGLEFEVTPAVLIPRPETELLVEHAIAWLKGWDFSLGEPVVLDVGTGCGCIAISLAVNLTGLRLVAMDISPAALAVATRNAQQSHVSDRISFLEADLIPDSLVPGSFPLIVANLPYIPTTTLQKLPIYGHEPTLALDGGPDGLALIRRLLRAAHGWLAPGGCLLAEIEASEGPAALLLARDAFSEATIHVHKDLAGLDRLLEIQL